MNNLTDTILVKHNRYEIEEFTKQGDGLQFDSGVEQRIVKYSIPSISVRISYVGLDWSEYELIRTAYENNHSNTFICEFESPSETVLYVASDYVVTDYIDEAISRIDMRSELMGINSAVWGFKEFDFNINARTRLYTGTITLVSSVFFNFTEYQDLFTQSSSYTISASTDETFINILDDASPYEARLGYANNALFSNIGQSLRHAKNKGGLKRVWTLKWLLEETNFLKILTFYRKKSGIMGEFGFPDYGTNTGILLSYVDADYIIDQSDYIESAASDNLSNARFMQDSFKYKKRVDGLYTCEADFVEVKL